MSAPKVETNSTTNGPKPAEDNSKPQAYYDRIKDKFASERDLRLNYRPEGTAQYTSDLTGDLARYETDPYAGEAAPRPPIDDTVECLFIGGGFSALLTAARLRERGVTRDRKSTRLNSSHMVQSRMPSSA